MIGTLSISRNVPRRMLGLGFYLLVAANLQAQGGGAPTPDGAPRQGETTAVAVLAGARAAMEREEFDEARRAFQLYLAERPQNEQVRLELSRAHLFAGDLDQALAAIDRILSASPESPDALLVRGLIQSRRQNFEAATQDFQRVIQISPEYCDAHAALIRTLLQQNNPAGARQAAEAVPATCRDDEGVSTALTRAAIAADPRGNCDGRYGRFYREAEDPRLRAAREALHNDDLESALSQVTLILREQPANVDALLLRGIIAVRQRRLEDAIRDFEAVLERAPDYCDARYALAQVRLRMRQPDAARTLVADCPWCAEQPEGAELLKRIGRPATSKVIGRPDETVTTPPARATPAPRRRR